MRAKNCRVGQMDCTASLHNLSTRRVTSIGNITTALSSLDTQIIGEEGIAHHAGFYREADQIMPRQFGSRDGGTAASLSRPSGVNNIPSVGLSRLAHFAGMRDVTGTLAAGRSNATSHLTRSLDGGCAIHQSVTSAGSISVKGSRSVDESKPHPIPFASDPLIEVSRLTEVEGCVKIDKRSKGRRITEAEDPLYGEHYTLKLPDTSQALPVIYWREWANGPHELVRPNNTDLKAAISKLCKETQGFQICGNLATQSHSKPTLLYLPTKMDGDVPYVKNQFQLPNTSPKRVFP